MGSNNTVETTGGYYNGARNIVGSGNDLSVGGSGSNLNLGLNVLSSDNDVSAGGVGSNLNAGFNVFGGNNTVAAGPGPLALAGAVFQNLQDVTQTGPGIAINGNPFGGAAATSGQSSTVRMANAVFDSPKTPKAASPGGPVTKPVSHRITTSVKNFKDAVNGVIGGHNGRAPKPGADSTSKKGQRGQYEQKGQRGQYEQKGQRGQYEQKGQRGQYEQKGQVDDIGSRLS